MIRFIKYDGGQPRLVTIPRWAIGLGLVAAFLVGVLALFLAAGVALIAIPTLLVVGGVAAWLRRGKALGGRSGIVPREQARPHPTRPGTQRDDIIDAEFTIVDRDDDQTRR